MLEDDENILKLDSCHRASMTSQLNNVTGLV